MKNAEFLRKILLSDDVIKSITDNLKQLLEIIPELSSTIGFDHHHPHHHLDVFNHTLYAISHSKKDFEIRLALLIHDIGKPLCYQIDGDVYHFHGHAEKSYAISKDILKRLELDEKFADEILFLIKNHDTLIDVDILNYEDLSITTKLLEVQYADAKAHNPDKVKKRLDILNNVTYDVERKFKISL